MTSITVYERQSGGTVPIAEWRDGEWASGAGEMQGIFGPEAPAERELKESLDGPHLFVGEPREEPNQKAGDRVYVRNTSEVPDGKVAHHDEDDGLYYVAGDGGGAAGGDGGEAVIEARPRRAGGEPGEDPAEKAAGLLERLLDTVSRG